MQLLTDITLALIGSYLSLTSTLTGYIYTALPFENSTQFTQEASEQTTIAQISSAYQTIPKILIENSAFQNAAVLDATTQQQKHYTPTEALVNIFCTYTTDEYIRATTGTGYFIDKDGIILTNAHVAQFLLLEGIKGDTQCIVRTGNPAEPTYEADLLYIPPAWVQKNAHLITNNKPQGTGERDYALLYITSGLNNKPMPRHFPFLTIDTSLLKINSLHQNVTAAGYPAETLFAETDATAKLIPKEAPTSIEELMTFGSNYADLFTIAGSNIGEQGSSGGPVVNQKGEAIGLISTRGDDTQFGQGSLRAITLSYIDRTITEETGFNLQKNLGGNLPFRSKLFKETLVPFLQQMLQRELGT
jgi:S1-C subfamily serine protease